MVEKPKGNQGGETSAHAETVVLPIGAYLDPLAPEIQATVPEELRRLLDQRDGYAALCAELPRLLAGGSPEEGTDVSRIWELCGLYYKVRGRWSEALAIFDGLYQTCLAFQKRTGQRIHKGMPLVWMSECYDGLGYTSIARRFLMLTLCEDAIREKGTVPAESTGVYFRFVWGKGMSDADLRRYADRFYKLFQVAPEACHFPEECLLQIDDRWNASPPSVHECLLYPANRLFIKDLLGRLGERQGRALENLAAYLLSVMPGCRVTRRQRTPSTEYDLVCAVDGMEADFRSELGRYFVCECKDWDEPANFTSMAKFCRVLDSVKCRFGILFSRSGISGEGESRYAEREQLKMFQDRGVIVVVVDEPDLHRVAEGENFTVMLREKYEQVRLDLIER